MYDLGENKMQLTIMSSGKKVHGYSMQKSSCYSLLLSMQGVLIFIYKTRASVQSKNVQCVIQTKVATH